MYFRHKELKGTGIKILSSFFQEESAAIAYARAVSSTPLAFGRTLITKLRLHFTEREIVIIASTAAQVNYWARLVQALGIPPAGFLKTCPVIDLAKYNTRKE